MFKQTNKILLAVTVFALLGNLFHFIEPFSTQAQTESSDISEQNNSELLKLYNEDQSDRSSEKMSAKDFDFHAFAERDLARQQRVMEIYSQNEIKTGSDFFHAAMILQHGSEPEDYLLAHELCVVAMNKGEKRAKWLAAATEDRFLMNIGRPQRFGTQYKSDGEGKPLRLYQVDSTVTDELRKQMNVQTLAKAKEREAKLNQNE